MPWRTRRGRIAALLVASLAVSAWIGISWYGEEAAEPQGVMTIVDACIDAAPQNDAQDSPAPDGEAEIAITPQLLAALRLPKVAEELRLTEKQKLDISRLLRTLPPQPARGKKSRQARAESAALVEAAAQAKRILTPQQFRSWLQLAPSQTTGTQPAKNVTDTAAAN